MSHARQQIRDQVVAMLLGLPTTGDNVFPTRFRRIAEDKTPCLLVFTQEEESKLAVAAPPGVRRRIVSRQLTLSIKALGRGEHVEDQLDTIAAEIEGVLGGDPRLGALVVDTVLTSTDLRFDDESDLKTGEADLLYRINYHTRENGPQILIGD